MSKPLIKWPGGKTSEIGQFLPLIPEYDRYIEPFVGGGALYFYLRPEKAVINDISENLMEFYALTGEQNEEFKKDLYAYRDSFEALQEACEKHYDQLLAVYKLYAYADHEDLNIKGLQVHKEIARIIASDPAVITDLMPDPEVWIEAAQASLEDKIRRTVANNHKKPFSDEDLHDNLVTGFTSGFYLYFRDIFNEIATGKREVSRAYRIANFYFIREYCYGSMFRYNRKGEFNIPYGGISYNRKDLKEKLDRIFHDSTKRLLDRTTLHCGDFEALMRELDLTEKDFLFLDPPYDTEFSEYEGRDFGHTDQERLAQFLTETKAKFLLVIKNTEYIWQLYENRGFRVLAFENQYMYNVRSRNERKAEHLIITNVEEGNIPWIRESF